MQEFIIRFIIPAAEVSYAITAIFYKQCSSLQFAMAKRYLRISNIQRTLMRKPENNLGCKPNVKDS